ncbi:hypothetical protein [Streptomyces sp. NPDC051677]|uniref:hypothetical protein n=1 Tax=Streptomyces sp. NPDC051677 TaxID=3365669 RepID=UPI0037D36A42
MAIDPARIRRRAMEAEQSGRRTLNAGEAAVALRALAVVVDGGPRDDPCGDVVALEQVG